ncbi:cobalt-zinc-cadmium efflux system membrane fusion protein [Chitinophaga dinghuensis]|uniref:Cobalt-zinc-cadmium efflux system membrane fusion protein n=1 Tax=Chitinophaga dinghuensis TaxID=1539050 RepID=A0A327WCN7_9BACT|nr:efflux RND transporter periplasmic adaptor subunit [Chitinophaga dinghuensis]RAJ87999.1 cobalt-zinc-cadmium efflux system membrane fusion protein [Chitinophaga dinghuensis]
MKKTIILLYTCNALLMACQNKPQEAKAPVAVVADTVTNTVELTPEQIKNGDIQTGAVTVKTMHSLLRVNGVVDVPPQNVVSVSMPLGGYLKTMKLLPGMPISKGQVLATLEDPQYIQLQQDYLMAKSKLRYLEADYLRQKELNESKANSDKVFQQAKSEYEGQKVTASALREKLQLININPDKLSDASITKSASIYAPISGFVTKVNVNTGRYVSPTDVLFELINPADLHLSLTVFQKDLPYLAEDQQIICYPVNNPDEKYTATIHLITRNVDESRSSEVHCHFNKYDKKLVPGMFMNAEIELNNAHTLAVPEGAVVKWQNKNYVFVADSKKTFTMTPVETGTTYDGYTEIKTDLAGKTLVTKNAYTLLMQLKNSGEEE